MAKLKDRYQNQVDFEEVLLDASNIPEFNRGRMEGKRELPISKTSVYTVGILFLLISEGNHGEFLWCSGKRCASSKEAGGPYLN
jgi:hypothetical protein